MNDFAGLKIDDKWILSKRGRKNLVDPHSPYAWLVEEELSAKGTLDKTGIIFLTNRECPFHCLMCDLWKNTTNFNLEPGQITEQIKFALKNMQGARHVKLYNSGSFFDKRAIPPEDYKAIADLLKDFETVIVESHPAFINDSSVNFRDLLKPELQIAIGLETVEPRSIEVLNKKMTLDDFRRSVHFLSSNNISSRAFILLRPPFMDESEGIWWSKKSIDFAFECGVECCTIIPVRNGNGALDFLATKGFFNRPDIESLEEVLEYGILLGKGRVFADTWDLGLFSKCSKCLDDRINRITYMNNTQEIARPLSCSCVG